ncbi:unnamed protein product, partial [Prorocentrum cordatum]
WLRSAGGSPRAAHGGAGALHCRRGPARHARDALRRPRRPPGRMRRGCWRSRRRARGGSAKEKAFSEGPAARTLLMFNLLMLQAMPRRASATLQPAPATAEPTLAASTSGTLSAQAPVPEARKPAAGRRAASNASGRALATSPWTYTFNELSEGSLNGQDSWWVPIHSIAGASMVMKVATFGYDSSLCAQYPYTGAGVQNYFYRRFQTGEPLPISAGIDKLTLEYDWRTPDWGGHFGLGMMESDTSAATTCVQVSITKSLDMNLWLSTDPSASPSVRITPYWVRIRLEVSWLLGPSEGLGTLQYMVLGQDDAWQAMDGITNFPMTFSMTSNGCDNPYLWNALSGRFVASPGGLDNIQLEWVMVRTAE